MGFKIYDRVVLKSDAFIATGVKPGEVGGIVERHEDICYEVAFYDANDNLTAQIVVKEDDIELVKKAV